MPPGGRVTDPRGRGRGYRRLGTWPLVAALLASYIQGTPPSLISTFFKALRSRWSEMALGHPFHFFGFPSATHCS